MARILTVDDEQITLMSLKEEITDLGHEVVGSAGSGPAAVALAHELAPDLIFMDINMPGVFDGIEAASKIEEELSIPVIFITAYSNEKYLNKIKKIGPFGYITKPFKKIELDASIHIALYRRRAEQVLQNKVRDEMIINQLLTVISQEIDPYERMGDFLDLIHGYVKLPGIVLYEKRDDAFVRTCWRVDNHQITADQLARLDFSEFVASTGDDRIFCYGKTKKMEPQFRQQLVEAGIESFLHVPVTSGGRRLAGLIFISFSCREEDSDEFRKIIEIVSKVAPRLLEIISQSVSIILEKHHRLLAIQNIEQEKALKEKLLMRSEHFASLGQLSSSIAHEINQPLHNIKILTDSTLYWDKKDKKLPYEDLIQNQVKISAYVDHIDKIIKNLRLLISSPDRLRIRRVNINETIDSIVGLYKQKLKAKSIRLDLDLCDCEASVMITEIHLQQLVVNIVDNAAKALSTIESDDKMVCISTGYREGHVFLRISDNGPGISDQAKKNIFAPFFSTFQATVHESMGMGLFIVSTIAKTYGASIEITDGPEGGAVFTIMFQQAV